MKQYDGEKAIISLTSWKARINTVYKTLFSLLQQCPGFHIVLVLSEEEFPQKEAELPDSLMTIVNTDLIELLWVYKNYKSFKKILFTMDKYRDVPVISADDDCYYICNYAEKLYNNWLENKNCIITINSYYKPNRNQKIYSNFAIRGPASIFYDNNFCKTCLNLLSDKTIASNQDDNFYNLVAEKLNINVIKLDINMNDILIFHDEVLPLFNLYAKQCQH